MKRKTFLLIGLMSLFACLLPASMHADELNDIKAAMKQRMAAVDQLLMAQKVGENMEGYLSVLGQLNADEDKLVQAENKDRKTVYASIASKTGSSIEKVGKSRANQIRSKAKNGIKVQKPDGSWMVK